MASKFLHLAIIACALVAAWFVVDRFSPDPLVTKLCQIAIFIIALYVIVMQLLPMAGIS